VPRLRTGDQISKEKKMQRQASFFQNSKPYVSNSIWEKKNDEVEESKSTIPLKYKARETLLYIFSFT
jgi:hypothetical protein